jgi:hypothetical protein
MNSQPATSSKRTNPKKPVHASSSAAAAGRDVAAAAAPSVDSVRCEFLAALSARAMILAQHYHVNSEDRANMKGTKGAPRRVSAEDRRRQLRRQRRSDPQELLESLSSHYGSFMMHLASDAAAVHASDIRRRASMVRSSASPQCADPSPATGVRWSASAAKRFMCSACNAVFISRCSLNTHRRSVLLEQEEKQVASESRAPANVLADTLGTSSASSDTLQHPRRQLHPQFACSQCLRSALAGAVTSDVNQETNHTRGRFTNRKSSSTRASPRAVAAFVKSPCRRKRRRSASAPPNGHATPLASSDAAASITLPPRVTLAVTAKPQRDAPVRQAGAPPSAARKASPLSAGANAKGKALPPAVSGTLKKQPPRPAVTSGGKSSSSSPAAPAGGDFLGALGL